MGGARVSHDVLPGSAFWFDPGRGRGHEQAGRRPVLVLSDRRLSSLGLAIVVPLTSVARGWELHVAVKLAGRTSYALSEQVRSVSVERLSGALGEVSYGDLEEVRAMVRTLVS